MQYPNAKNVRPRIIMDLARITALGFPLARFRELLAEAINIRAC